MFNAKVMPDGEYMRRCSHRTEYNERKIKISINLKKTTEAMPYIHYVALLL